MSDNLKIPWERYAVVIKIVETLENRRRWCGKTMLQKLVYFLQEIAHIPIGYRFLLYYYGPYSKELNNDLYYLEFLNAIKITYSEGSYQISLGEDRDFILKKGGGLLKKYRSQFKKIIDHFHNFDARTLELLATIVYIQKDAERKGEKITKEELLDSVKNIKVKFSEAEIEDKINCLIKERFLEI